VQTASVIAGVAAIAGHGLAVLALWLRLRGRVRHEQARGGCIVDLARALAKGGEIDERRPDGSWLKLSIPGGARDARGEHG
jgi:hypothetical protein